MPIFVGMPQASQRFFTVDIHTHILPSTLPDWKSKFGYGEFVSLEHHKPCCARMMIDNEFFREIESNNWDLNQPELFPIFEAMQDLDMCLFVHPWWWMAKTKMPKYWLPWLVGMPSETSLAISSMIFGGIFEKLPRLRVAFAHGGGSF